MNRAPEDQALGCGDGVGGETADLEVRHAISLPFPVRRRVHGARLLLNSPVSVVQAMGTASRGDGGKTPKPDSSGS